MLLKIVFEDIDGGVSVTVEPNVFKLETDAARLVKHIMDQVKEVQIQAKEDEILSLKGKTK